MMDLASVLSTAPPEEPSECRVDVSDLVGNAPDGTPTIFVFREPDVPALFLAEKASRAVRAQNLNWTEEFCQTLSVMAFAHIAPAVPASQNVHFMYAAMAKDRPKLFRRLLQAFKKGFPELSAEAIEEKKGD